MKKYLAGIAAVLLFVASPLFAQGTSHNIVAKLATNTGATVPTATGSCVRAVAWSAAGSTATVLFEQSSDGTTWTTSHTFTDPGATATTSAWYSGKYSRARISAYTSGTVSADVVWAPCTLIPTNITSLNKVTITAPAAAATLTIANNKTLTASNSLTLAGTDATTMTFPSSSATVARTDAAQTFTGAQTFSSAPVLSAGIKDTITAKASNGAIASAPGYIAITKTSALGSSTLATPTATTHDGYRLTIVSTTAFAHVITIATGKLNAAATTTITFTSAAIGDSITLVAYQGIWYLVGSTGTITLS